MHTLISRADAAANHQQRYFTGKSCKRGHVAQRFTVSGNCATCAAEFQGKFRSGTRAVEAHRRAVGLVLMNTWAHPDDWPVVEALADAMREDRERAYSASVTAGMIASTRAAIVGRPPTPEEQATRDRADNITLNDLPRTVRL